MKVLRLLIILIITPLLLAGAEIKNPDNPAKGTWDFKLEKQWSVSQAGETPLAGINRLRVGESGKVFIHDGKNKKYYIFSPAGEFLEGFGKKGEGPGEIQWIGQARFFLVGDKFVVTDRN
ncbi:MAG: hypothetical protein GY940_17645, partial [bacterium]|nr:hypothetical protein [bacterium]